MALKAEFLTSVAHVEDAPHDGKPEIAFMGRSNVGKSSLINALLNRKGLAKTSATPGKTQLLNYFIINDKFYFVDMPGYGYAQASKEKRFEWSKLIERYLTSRKELRGVGILIDSRHEALANDVDAVEWLSEKGIPFFIVLTKQDKVKQQELAGHMKMLKEAVPTAMNILPTSAQMGRGMRELEKFILGIV